MKLAPNKILLLLLITTAILTGCSKDDDVAPIDQLPPATQTGAGTFGCLINGEAFVEIGHPNSLNFNCYYQYVDGGFYFSIKGRDEVGNFSSVKLATEDKEIFEGETYSLLNQAPGKAFGRAGFNSGIHYGLQTNETYTGEMTITNMDLENHIVSGTFWFDVENPITGETIEIREGRFDSHFGM